MLCSEVGCYVVQILMRLVGMVYQKYQKFVWLPVAKRGTETAWANHVCIKAKIEAEVMVFSNSEGVATLSNMFVLACEKWEWVSTGYFYCGMLPDESSVHYASFIVLTTHYDAHIFLCLNKSELDVERVFGKR